MSSINSVNNEEKYNEKEKILLGCNSEMADESASAILWINNFYRKKAQEFRLYNDNVAQYVLPEFWQTKEEFCGAKDYSIKVYKTVIIELAKQMDALHHTSFGEKGWDIILFQWLYIYIESFYDKYVRISYAVSRYPDLFMKSSDTWYIPRENYLADDEILQTQQYNDVYNFLFLGCEDNLAEEQCQIIQYAHGECEDSTGKSRLRKMIVDLIKRMVCTQELTMYFSASGYLDLSKTTLEILSRGRICRLMLPCLEMAENGISLEMRKGLKRNLDFADPFINMIYEYLWKHIPLKYVEDFQVHYAKYKEMKLQYPAKLVDGVNVYSNLYYKIFVADAINHGSEFEMIQHGGNRCIEKYIGWWEIEIANKYYSWGNGFVKDNRGNMYAMPLSKTLSIKKSRRRQDKILFVGYVNYPYITRFWNFYTMKMEEFYEQEDGFFRALEEKGRNKLRVRCYPNDLWWERKKTLGLKFPWMQFDQNPRYYTSLFETKLVVTNLISTTCMESINCDIPTIIFCSADFFVPDENAVEILNELRRVQVLVDDPKDAADIINKNEEHIEEWWNEKERKKVLNKFKQMYAPHSMWGKYKWINQLLKESRVGN